MDFPPSCCSKSRKNQPNRSTTSPSGDSLRPHGLQRILQLPPWPLIGHPPAEVQECHLLINFLEMKDSRVHAVQSTCSWSSYTPPPSQEAFMSCVHTGSISVVDLKQVAGGKRTRALRATRADKVGFTPLGRHCVTPSCKSEWRTEIKKGKSCLLASSELRMMSSPVTWVQLKTLVRWEHTAPPTGW